MCQGYKFFCKTVQKLYDPNNPDNAIYCKDNCSCLCKAILVIITAIPIISLLYYIGVNITFSIIKSNYPGYNITTGCPLDIPKCAKDQHMSCYEENMTGCYIFGIITVVILITILVFIVVLAVLLYIFGKCIRESIENLIIRYMKAADLVVADDITTNININDAVTNYHSIVNENSDTS